MTDILTSSGFSIIKNDEVLTGQMLAAIQQVTVENELNVPATFSFKLSMMDFVSNDWQGINLDTFKPGDSISISMGLGQLKKLIEGEIYALEPHFGNCSSLDVSGYDRMYWLNFGTRTKAYKQMTDSQIAADIATSLGLKSDTQNTKTVIPYLLQNNQSNSSFLRERCTYLNYEMLVNGIEFIYRASQEGQAPVVTFTYGVDLVDLSVRLKVLTQDSKVKVVAWDPLNKTVMSGQTDSASPQAKMGGTQTGSAYEKKFPSAASSVENLYVVDSNDATHIAQAQYNQELSQFIEGEGSCVGNSEIKAGINIRINGLGQRFSGIYYVISSSHTFDYEQGYQTSFKIRRSGV